MKELVKNVRRDEEEISAMLNQGAQLLDVRSPAEFEAGHLEHAINIPLEEIGDHIRTIRSWNLSLVVVCRSGLRSQVATGILKSAGLHAVDGGAWQFWKSKPGMAA